MHAPTLRSERLVLRALEASDLDELHRILAEPAVARWWRLHDRPSLEDWLADDGVTRWAVVADGAVVGKAQAYEERDPEYRHAGIDLFLDPRLHRRGLGGETVRVVARWLLEERGHHRLVIDPAGENERAIRCYERVGFRRVGVLRRYWHDHVRGEWADGLLLDLLAGELREA